MTKVNSSHSLSSSFYSHVFYNFLLYAAYFTLCFIYSSCHLDFIKQRKNSKNTIFLISIISLTLVIILCYIGLTIYPLERIHHLLFTYIAILAFLFIRAIKSLKSIRVSPEELEIDGLKFHTYTGSEINAFYDSTRRKVCVHEELLKILAPDELKALLQYEIGHQYQRSRKSFRVLQGFTYLTLSFWFLGGLVLVIIAGSALSMIIDYLLFGTHSSETLELFFLFTFLHPILSSILLSLTSIFWTWEYEADLYATEKIKTEAFMKALVKVHLARKLGKSAKFAKLEGCFIKVSLDSIPYLTLFSIAKELFIQTLLFSGSIDYLFKPLEKIHPPLHLRLRALRTASSATVSHKQPDLC